MAQDLKVDSGEEERQGVLPSVSDAKGSKGQPCISLSEALLRRPAPLPGLGSGSASCHLPGDGGCSLGCFLASPVLKTSGGGSSPRSILHSKANRY